jgi:hypothetical protein
VVLVVGGQRPLPPLQLQPATAVRTPSLTPRNRRYTTSHRMRKTSRMVTHGRDGAGPQVATVLFGFLCGAAARTPKFGPPCDDMPRGSASPATGTVMTHAERGRPDFGSGRVTAAAGRAARRRKRITQPVAA